MATTIQLRVRTDHKGVVHIGKAVIFPGDPFETDPSLMYLVDKGICEPYQPPVIIRQAAASPVPEPEPEPVPDPVPTESVPKPEPVPEPEKPSRSHKKKTSDTDPPVVVARD